MINVQKDDYMALERLIERYRLQGLLEIIAFICGKMAERVRQQWGDEILAQTWDRDASAIDKVRAFLSN